MKLKKSIVLLALLALIPVSGSLPAQTFRASRTPLEVTLSSLTGVTEVLRLESTEFSEKYQVKVRQMVNHDEVRDGFFEQRIFVMHVGADRPTVMVTEGYGADYASNPRYREELSRLLNANLVVVEHRFFSQSTPQPRTWKHLTGEQAMTDLHKIREILRPVYQGKWIATGISKGGQTALMYRTLFPDDVDITVSYVGPLCQNVEDGRHEPFIKNKAGTKEDREKVLTFQKELLIRKDSLMPVFTSFCEKAGYKFTEPLSDIFDFAVLEYSFAFWQWGTPVKEIPAITAPDSLLFAHFMKISSPDYMMRETPNMSFFVQAAKQLGYYGYDTNPFRFKVTRTRFIPDSEKEIAKKEAKEAKKAAKMAKKNDDQAPEPVINEQNDKEITGKWVTRKYPAMELKTSKGYLRKIFLPDYYKPRFNKKLYKMQSDFVKKTDAKLVFLYGEWDPWTAAAVPDPGKPNVLYFVQPGGNHRTRIGSLPQEMRDRLLGQLETWLNE